MSHNYSEVLPALLVSLVSYARMIVFNNLWEDWFKFCIVVYKRFLKFHSLFCLLIIFVRFGPPLDHLCHLNITYVYAKEVVYTFLVFVLLDDKRQFKHGGV